jgi:hypothetical protein
MRQEMNKFSNSNVFNPKFNKNREACSGYVPPANLICRITHSNHRCKKIKRTCVREDKDICKRCIEKDLECTNPPIVSRKRRKGKSLNTKQVSCDRTDRTMG